MFYKDSVVQKEDVTLL